MSNKTEDARRHRKATRIAERLRREYPDARLLAVLGGILAISSIAMIASDKEDALAGLASLTKDFETSLEAYFREGTLQ